MPSVGAILATNGTGNNENLAATVARPDDPPAKYTIRPNKIQTGKSLYVKSRLTQGTSVKFDDAKGTQMNITATQVTVKVPPGAVTI